MFRYRLFSAMGGEIGEIELAVLTLEPGEGIATGAGEVIQILEVVYLDDVDSPYRALVTAEPIADADAKR